MFHYAGQIETLVKKFCSGRVWPSNGDVHIAGEGLQSLDLCFALLAIEQGGVFIIRQRAWQETPVCTTLPEGPPRLVPFYEKSRCTCEKFKVGSQ